MLRVSNALANTARFHKEQTLEGLDIHQQKAAVMKPNINIMHLSNSAVFPSVCTIYESGFTGHLTCRPN